jgi:hypothetical protein
MRERRFAFVLRLWIEHSDREEAPLLRGSLQAAGAEQARYFTSLADLMALLSDLIEPRDPSGADAPQAR